MKDMEKENSIESRGEIVLYQPDENIRLEVRIDTDTETVWLTQQQIADLFATKRPAITKHLANIFQSGELDKISTCSILEHVGNDGRQHYSTTYYNLDVIISVGFALMVRKMRMGRLLPELSAALPVSFMPPLPPTPTASRTPMWRLCASASLPVLA